MNFLIATLHRNYWDAKTRTRLSGFVPLKIKSNGQPNSGRRYERRSIIGNWL